MSVDPLRNFHRDVFAARLCHEMLSETHVVVGDHPPERRVVHELPTMRALPDYTGPDWQECVRAMHQRPDVERLHDPDGPYDPNLNPG